MELSVNRPVEGVVGETQRSYVPKKVRQFAAGTKLVGSFVLTCHSVYGLRLDNKCVPLSCVGGV
jgi:hypothetical protein